MKLSTDNIIAWSKNYANWLPIIQWSGWIIITTILAKLFWVLALHFSMPDVSSQKSQLRSPSVQSKANQSVNVSQLVNKHLFGNTDTPVVAQVEEVVERETNLNLKLRGIYASENTTNSNSIIEDGSGKQAVYFIDDKLQVSGRVFLRQVHMDRVILETNGVNEVLRLKDILPESMKSNKKQRTSTSKESRNRVDDKRKNRQISKSLNKYKKQLQDDPLSLVGLVNYKPKMNNGEMIGIEISPGKDKRLFTQLGLRPRDVITSINGVSLSDPQNAMQLMSDIQNMQELQVEINRGRESISLLLNLDQSDNLNSDQDADVDLKRNSRARPKSLNRSGI